MMVLPAVLPPVVVNPVTVALPVTLPPVVVNPVTVALPVTLPPVVVDPVMVALPAVLLPVVVNPVTVALPVTLPPVVVDPATVALPAVLLPVVVDPVTVALPVALPPVVVDPVMVVDSAQPYCLDDSDKHHQLKLMDSARNNCSNSQRSRLQTKGKISLLSPQRPLPVYNALPGAKASGPRPQDQNKRSRLRGKPASFVIVAAAFTWFSC